MTDDPDSGAGARVDPSRLVGDLTRPEAYAGAVDEVGFLQTHVSLLFFAGERVYKVKRPVNLGFLDFTTLERRKRFCEEEVRLNRRLAPDVYLGVVPITRDTRSADGRLRIGGPGAAVEWAVEMLRLPAHRMLASLLERGEIDNEPIHALVSLLADFHANAATGRGVDEHGSPAAVRANVEQNFTQLRPFAGPVGSSSSIMSERLFRHLEEASQRRLSDLHGLLERRVATGRIRDGHGDLHAENVCFLPSGPVAYDCIEFSRAFRCGDVAADLAFLAMDLDQRGFPGFSKYLMKRYASATDDPDVRTLEDLYKGYRALVRAKVEALTSSATGVDRAERERHRRRAMQYAQLAGAYELPPAMILMAGLPATGKSWLADRLAGALRAAVFHSDVRRKVLAGIAPVTRAPAAYGAGLYAPEARQRTYRSLLESALANLRSGHSTLVDATFSRREYRRDFVDAATRMGLSYYVVHVTAPEDTVRARMRARQHDASTASDADFGVYLRERAAFEPPTEVPARHVLEVVSGERPAEACSSDLIDRMIELDRAD